MVYKLGHSKISTRSLSLPLLKETITSASNGGRIVSVQVLAKLHAHNAGVDGRKIVSAPAAPIRKYKHRLCESNYQHSSVNKQNFPQVDSENFVLVIIIVYAAKVAQILT